MFWVVLIVLVACAYAEDAVASENLIRHNFNTECEKDVNELIQLNLAATFQYIAKSTHFRQYDSEYSGVAIMFSVHAREKLNDAKHLMKYLIHRGAEIHWTDIPAPPVTDWTHPKDVISQALAIEKNILQHIIDTHTCAQVNHDPDLMHDMADRMIVGEENTIFELGSYVQHLDHDGPSDVLVLPALSKKLFMKYKDYRDCFHAVDDPEKHDH